MWWTREKTQLNTYHIPWKFDLQLLSTQIDASQQQLGLLSHLQLIAALAKFDQNRGRVSPRPYQNWDVAAAAAEAELVAVGIRILAIRSWGCTCSRLCRPRSSGWTARPHRTVWRSATSARSRQSSHCLCSRRPHVRWPHIPDSRLQSEIGSWQGIPLRST